jgi:hypothetical protein
MSVFQYLISETTERMLVSPTREVAYLTRVHVLGTYTKSKVTVVEANA